MHVLVWLFPVFQGLMLGVVAAAFHEAGHLVAAPLVGIKIKTIGLKWKGLYTVREAGPPAKNLIVSLAGPLTNLALLAFWPLSHRFGLANLCFSFFNILPMEGSDGERIWKCWRAIKRERRSRDSDTYAAQGTTQETTIPAPGLEVLAIEPSHGED
jgi:Zn-dependent protease